MSRFAAIERVRLRIPSRHVRRTWYFGIASQLGAYRKYRAIDFRGVRRLVFVCKGNICRSPFAEAVATAVGVNSASYGLDTEIGRPANPSACRAAEEFGLSLAAHETKQFSTATVYDSDLIVAMEPGHLTQIEEICIERQCRVALLGLFVEPAMPYIFDPYGMRAADFIRCFAVINAAATRIAEMVSEG